jgi:hypothetical protein
VLSSLKKGSKIERITYETISCIGARSRDDQGTVIGVVHDLYIVQKIQSAVEVSLEKLKEKAVRKLVVCRGGSRVPTLPTLATCTASFEADLKWGSG